MTNLYYVYIIKFVTLWGGNMKIDISKLINDTEYEVVINSQLQLKSLNAYGKHIQFNKPINVTGGIYKVDDKLHVSVKIAYEYTDTCDRCLEKIKINSETVLNALISNDINYDDSDEIVIQKENDKVDLTDGITSAILLDMPMKSLCSDSCKGFCQNCGKNLNKEDCKCENTIIDPRLEKLKEYLK